MTAERADALAFTLRASASTPTSVLTRGDRRLPRGRSTLVATRSAARRDPRCRAAVCRAGRRCGPALLAAADRRPGRAVPVALASMRLDALSEGWGFRVVTEIVWQKLTKHGRPWFGMGRTVRASHETALVCLRGPRRR